MIEFVDLLRSTGTVDPVRLTELEGFGARTKPAGQVASVCLNEGLAKERDLARALATFEGHPAIVLAESTLDLAALEFLPEDVASEHQLLPVAVDRDSLTLAAVSLAPAPVHRSLAAIAGRRIVLLRGVDVVVDQLIPYAYTAFASSERRLRGRLSTTNEPFVAQVLPARKDEVALASLLSELGTSLDTLRAVAQAQTAGAAEATPGPGIAPTTAQAVSLPRTMSPQPLPRTMTPRPGVSPTTAQAVSLPRTMSPQPLPRTMTPASAVPGAVPRLPSRPSIAAVAPPILVVEDDEAIRRLACTALRADGHAVLEAGDAQQAITLMRATKPALVLLDGMLPGMHGFELCATIKRSSYSDVPVVLMSAVHRGFEQARQGQEVHGADAYIEKPFSVQLLRSVVARVLGAAPPKLPRPIASRAEIEDARAAAHWARVVEGDVDDALAKVDRWLALDPFSASAHVERGNLLLRKKDAAGALRAYETAVAFDPQDYPACVNLAMVYEKLGFLRTAKETWRRALALAPDDAARARIAAHIETAP